MPTTAFCAPIEPVGTRTSASGLGAPIADTSGALPDVASVCDTGAPSGIEPSCCVRGVEPDSLGVDAFGVRWSKCSVLLKRTSRRLDDVAAHAAEGSEQL